MSAMDGSVLTSQKFFDLKLFLLSVSSIHNRAGEGDQPVGG